MSVRCLDITMPLVFHQSGPPPPPSPNTNLSSLNDVPFKPFLKRGSIIISSLTSYTRNLICSFYLSVAARTSVWADPSMLLGGYASNQPTTILHPSPCTLNSGSSQRSPSCSPHCLDGLVVMRQPWELQTRGRYHGGRPPSSDHSLHSPTVIPPSALDKPSIMKRYHYRWTCSHTSPHRSPTMVTLHVRGLPSADGGMTVGLWRLSSLDGRRPPWYRPLVTELQIFHRLWNSCRYVAP